MYFIRNTPAGEKRAIMRPSSPLRFTRLLPWWQRGVQLNDAVVVGGYALLLGKRQAVRSHWFLPGARAGKIKQTDRQTDTGRSCLPRSTKYLHKI